MRIFLTTLTLFAVSLFAHFFVWKVRLPRRQMKTLIMVFLLTYAFWLCVAVIRHLPLLLLLHVSLYYWSSSLCYTITYSAIEADSPTLSLMNFVAAAGAGGRSWYQICRFMDERPFIGARLTALLKSSLIEQRGNRYVALGPQPLSFRLIFLFRKLYGSIPKGG